MQKRNFLLTFAVIGLFTLGLQPVFTANAVPNGGATLCVDWATKQIKFSKDWAKCPNKTSPLDLEAIGATGPKGDAGATGPAGPAGPSGSSFNLTSYPVLALDNSLIQEQPCADGARWNAIISRFGFANIETDAFGQAIRNKQWAIDLANGCQYPMSSIFQLPRATSVANLVHGTKTVRAGVGNGAQYREASGWKVPITQFDLDVLLDNDWHLCTNADPQTSISAILTANAAWSYIDSDTVRWSGSGLLIWNDNSPSEGDYPWVATSDGADILQYPYFCGPSAQTSSGLTYRSLGHGTISHLVPKPFRDF